MARYPGRIICLSEETTEILYLLGAGDRVVGVSGYTMRPPGARAKPKVSAFITARFDRIEALHPDLILAFSDLQADIVAELVRRGYPVVACNQRSIDEILRTIRMIGGLVGCVSEADALCARLETGLEAIRASAARLPHRPRVFFEEWHKPMISGIRWVEELVEVAGGNPIFPELREATLAARRIVQPDAVREAAPEIIVASWCGKRVRKALIAGRPGWDTVPAVRDGRIYEIRSPYILQPGPSALSEGARQLHAIICHAMDVPQLLALAPEEAWDRGH